MKSLSSRRAAMEVIVAAAIWISLWTMPWQSAWVGHAVWIRVALTVLLFLIPGACLFGMLNTGWPRLFGSLAAGFVLSHLLVACIGLLGRIFGFSFQIVKYGFVAAGLILISAFLTRRDAQCDPPVSWKAVHGEASEAWPLGVVIVLGFLLSLRHTFTSDDLSYLAYVTNWQFAANLNFSNILFGLDMADASRFWLSLLPMSQALLCDLSHVPGVLLLAGYLQPFLAALALAGWYELGRALGLPARWAAAAVALQVAFLVLWGGVEPLGGVASNLAGQMFFARMVEDKALATFLFAPVLVISVLQFQRQPGAQRLICILLIGLSFCLLHPIALAYTLLVIALMSVLRYTQVHRPREIAITLAALAVLIVPQGILRFVPDPLATTVTSVGDAANMDPNLFGTVVLMQKGGFFYGFNPRFLELDFSYVQSPLFRAVVGWGWLALALVITLLAISRVRESDAARYILACTALIVTAGVPYLGWLLGYFVSAQMLYRTLWFYPFGLGLAFAVWELARHTAEMPGDSNRLQNGLANVLILASLALVSFAAWKAIPAGLMDLSQKLSTYRQYVVIGQSLDAAISRQVVVFAPNPIGNYLPGLSSRAKVVSFRNWRQGVYAGLPVEEAKAREADVARFYTGNPSGDERMSMLKRYHAGFVIVRESHGEARWARGHRDDFHRVAAIPGYVLYRFDAADAQGSGQMGVYPAGRCSQYSGSQTRFELSHSPIKD